MSRNTIPIGLGVLALLIGAVAYMALKGPAAATGPTQAIPLELSSTATGNILAVYEIAPGASSARFYVDEVLRGFPRTVLGETDQVAGQIALDPTNPGSTQVGSILINARTLATDDATRDRAIRNFVLSANENEYVAFTPTALSGLPKGLNWGRPTRFRSAASSRFEA